MDDAPRTGDVPLEARSKVWIERDGEVLISEFRAALLRAVEAQGSVAAAAVALGLPNRTAWKKLREMEAAAGVSLLASGSGGRSGGGSRLTAAARELLDAFERLNEPVHSALASEFGRAAERLDTALEG